MQNVSVPFSSSNGQTSSGLQKRLITVASALSFLLKLPAHSSVYFFFRDLNKISDGIGSKFGRIISSLVSFVSGYVIGFIYVWQLTLVEIATFPLVVFVGGMFAKVGYSRWAHKEWGREGKEEGKKQEQRQ